MTRYNTWYNGSTTITLTGNPDECPDETIGPLSNSLGIGGMTVPDNSTLDRTTYDTNPFYFRMPSSSTKNLSMEFQSSTDYYIEETQYWKLAASKSGDGYDVTGFWTGTLPSANTYNFVGTKCWKGGDNYPSAGSKSNGENWHWNITARLEPDNATWTFDQTYFDADEVEWHTVIKFEGQAYTDGPRLVTTGDAPTTEGCLGCDIKSSQSDPEGPSETSGGSSSTGTSTRASSSAASTSGSSTSDSSTSGSSTGSGSRHVANLCSIVTLGAVAAVTVMFV